MSFTTKLSWLILIKTPSKPAILVKETTPGPKSKSAVPEKLPATYKLKSDPTIVLFPCCPPIPPQLSTHSKLPPVSSFKINISDEPKLVKECTPTPGSKSTLEPNFPVK